MQVESYFALEKAWAAEETCLKASESRMGMKRMIGLFFAWAVVTRSRGGPATGRCGDTHR